MNNDDLREIIWSYLRKTPFKQCKQCGCVCMWDENKTIVDFVRLGGDFICCSRCFWQQYFISHPFM